MFMNFDYDSKDYCTLIGTMSRLYLRLPPVHIL